MGKRVTLEVGDLIDMQPCDLSKRLALFGERKRLTVRQALKAGASVSDILWVAGRLKLRDQIVEFAKRAAAEVAHLKDGSGRYAAAYAADYATCAARDGAVNAAYAAGYAQYAAGFAADAAAFAADYATYHKAREEMVAKQKRMLIDIFG